MNGGLRGTLNFVADCDDGTWNLNANTVCILIKQAQLIRENRKSKR